MTQGLPAARGVGVADRRAARALHRVPRSRGHRAAQMIARLAKRPARGLCAAAQSICNRDRGAASRLQRSVRESADRAARSDRDAGAAMVARCRRARRNHRHRHRLQSSGSCGADRRAAQFRRRRRGGVSPSIAMARPSRASSARSRTTISGSSASRPMRGSSRSRHAGRRRTAGAPAACNSFTLAQALQSAIDLQRRRRQSESRGAR